VPPALEGPVVAVRLGRHLQEGAGPLVHVHVPAELVRVRRVVQTPVKIYLVGVRLQVASYVDRLAASNQPPLLLPRPTHWTDCETETIAF